MTKKLQQNLIVLAVFAIFAVFVYFKYLMAPLDMKYKNSLQKLSQTESRLEEMKRRALELPKLQAEMKMLELEVAELEQRLPKNREIPELLRMVTKTAQRYHLRITNFAPSPMAQQSNYNEIPFQITMQGTYHSLAHFLSDLGQESRILHAHNINYSAGINKENDTTINVSFTLIAYTFKG